MEQATDLLVCKSCKNRVTGGKYCSECSQAIVVKRISLGSIAHEVFHFFTHVDKGLPFTVKRLTTHPGTMQREYLEGQRVRHQKPFSMFLISATVLAIFLYWLNIILNKYYGAGNLREATFDDKYLVLLLMIMPLLFAIIVYLSFYSSDFNFAEILVFSLYNSSMFFLIVILANGLELVWPQLESRYVELPAYVVYNIFSFKNFFLKSNRWAVLVKSILCTVAAFLSITSLQDFFQRFT